MSTPDPSRAVDVVHSVGWWQHLLDRLGLAVPRSLCGVSLESLPADPEVGEGSPACQGCSRDVSWWWPLHCAAYNAVGSLLWLLRGPEIGIGWEVTATPDGRLEAEGLRWSRRWQRTGEHVAWVHGDDRADVERRARAWFPDDEHDFLWNDDAPREHLCQEFPVGAR